LVALRAPEELHALDALGGRRLERVERVDEAGRVTRERRIEAEPVDEHRALEGVEGVEGDRTTVKPQRHDPRDAEGRERPKRGDVEAPPCRGHEARTVGPTAPAQLVDAEGLGERRLELVSGAGDVDLDAAEFRELAP